MKKVSKLLDGTAEYFVNGKLMRQVTKDGIEGEWKQFAYREELQKIIEDGWMTMPGMDFMMDMPIQMGAKERAIELMKIIGIYNK